MAAKLPPGPSHPAVVQTIGWWTRPIPTLERNRARYGKRFTIRLLATPPFVMLSDPDELKQLFTAPPEVLHPGEGARILEPVIGRNSVILLDEQAHLEQRKLMLPAFHGEKMERLTGLMTGVTEQAVAEWPRGVPVPLHTRLQAVTLEVILRAVFGLDPGRRLERLRDMLTDVLAFGARPGLALPIMQWDIGGVTPWARFVRLREQADALIFELIEERRGESEERDDVLSMLLAARHEDDSPMTNVELRDELMTLLVAGHETTASELAWAFTRLVREPAVLRRLVDEIDRGDEDSYLTATIQEILRRRPVLPNAAPRLVKQSIQIGDWTYEPGACVVANAYLLHHDRDIYSEPYAFRPERFLDEPPGTYTWIPFGGGRRRCLGASFAMVEMKIMLRAVLSRLEIAPGTDGIEVSRRRSITISPRQSAMTVLRDRDSAGAANEAVPETTEAALA